MTKAPVPTEMLKRRDNTKRNRKFRLHSDCGPTKDVYKGYDSHPTGVINPFTGSTFPLLATAV